ncbi:iron complex transport system substrate-binding protein [Thermanaeromonas toyohensis ToBE]|uniref:Iron complex transport system substrate-binding protein n=1 Tax=Thermanaeromonas toyohensis ToBE TaxID=698762 RepID=A0A1W1VE52_9FIRM|nr:ABC transporter substrate-binding protein [Thermanaeromonas toyohensis]SMB91224.1 iron complex transport system substrate-binding protein [Thermanaeromonas toyohensis ToBE]
MKTRRILGLAIGLVLILSTLTGCVQKQTAQPAKGKITITDSLGRQVEVPCPPQRIVSVNSDVSEVICALGAQDKIVGVADTADFPPLIKDKAKVGQAFTPSVEKILELKPDIVFGYGKFLKSELAQKIEAAGIPLVYLDCYKVKTMAQDIKTLGQILGREKEAAEYVALFENSLKQVTERVKDLKPEEKVPVYLEGYTDYSANGPGSGGAEMLELVGGKNIAAHESVPYPTVSPEWVVSKNPQVIIKAASSRVKHGYGAPEEGMKKMREQIISRPGWQQIRAVKEGRVYVISSEIYTGPRASVGIAYFAKWLYPKLFADLDPEAIHKEFLSRFHGLELKGTWVYPQAR